MRKVASQIVVAQSHVEQRVCKRFSATNCMQFALRCGPTVVVGSLSISRSSRARMSGVRCSTL